MSPTNVVASAIPEPEPLTWDEICARHPDEWVCLAEVELTHPHKLRFRTARLIGHGKTQNESREQAARLFPQYQDVMNIYTTYLEIRHLRPRLIIDDETRAAFATHGELSFDDAPIADSIADANPPPPLADRVADDSPSPPLAVSELELELVEQRLQDDDDDPDAAIPWDVARADLLPHR